LARFCAGRGKRQVVIIRRSSPVCRWLNIGNARYAQIQLREQLSVRAIAQRWQFLFWNSHSCFGSRTLKWRRRSARAFFHSQAVAWTGVLFCGVASLTPEMEKAGNDDERKGHAAELTNC
jgi:hypothetical protein